MEVSDRYHKYPAIDYRGLKPYTKFPFILLSSQKDVEEHLERELKSVDVKITRGEKIVSLRTLDDGQFEATFDSSMKIVSKHIIGADGARSTVSRFVYCYDLLY
jgi:2-polyprenyl-6-methoxyphenol hydroxylase-like FAD-dependent oxidoreductase